MANCPDPRTCPIGCPDCINHVETCDADECATCDRIFEADEINNPWTEDPREWAGTAHDPTAAACWAGTCGCPGCEEDDED